MLCSGRKSSAIEAARGSDFRVGRRCKLHLFETLLPFPLPNALSAQASAPALAFPPALVFSPALAFSLVPAPTAPGPTDGF